MPFRLFSKKSKKSQKDEHSHKEDMNTNTLLSRQSSTSSTATSPDSIPFRPRSRLGPQRMSSSSASLPSIGRVSTFSASTQNSSSSTSSSRSSSSMKSKWRYSMEQFQGPTKVDPKSKYLSHAGVWAQAYAYGGR